MPLFFVVSDLPFTYSHCTDVRREQIYSGNCICLQQEVRESVNRETSIVNDWGCHIQLLTAVIFPLRSTIVHHMNSIVSMIFQAADKGLSTQQFFFQDIVY